MDQTIRKQSHDVQSPIVFDCILHRCVERQVMNELAPLDGVIDALDVGEHHPPGAQAKMPDIRITHHARG